MLEKLLFRKIEFWVVLLVIFTLCIGAILFGSIAIRYQRDGKFLGPVGALVLEVAKFPFKVQKVLSNKVPSGVKGNEKRFESRNGLTINSTFSADAFVVLPRVNLEKNSWEILFIDLLSHDQAAFDVTKQIKEATTRLAPSKVGYAEELSSVPGAPRLDGNLNLTFLSNSGILMQVNMDGDTLWANSDFRFHHTFNFSKDESYIWAIGTDINNLNPVKKPYNYSKLVNDLIVKVDASTGKTIAHYNIVNALVDENLENHLFVGRVYSAAKDPLHINDVEPVTIKSDYFDEDDVLLSIGNANMVMLFDTADEKVKWHSTRGLFHQHDVDVLDQNKIAVYNNNRIITDKDQVRKHNEIMVFDLQTGVSSTMFDDQFQNYDIRTVTQGLFDITPIGLLVAESDYARVLIFDETDPVFEYINKDNEGHPLSIGWPYIEINKDITTRLREKLQ